MQFSIVGVLDATEYESSYIGKIVWDIHHDRSSYGVAPIVEEKPPQFSGPGMDEGIPLTTGRRSSKRTHAPEKSKMKKGRRVGQQPSEKDGHGDYPSSSTMGVDAHARVNPSTPSQPSHHDEVCIICMDIFLSYYCKY